MTTPLFFNHTIYTSLRELADAADEAFYNSVRATFKCEWWQLPDVKLMASPVCAAAYHAKRAADEALLNYLRDTRD